MDYEYLDFLEISDINLLMGTFGIDKNSANSLYSLSERNLRWSLKNYNKIRELLAPHINLSGAELSVKISCVSMKVVLPDHNATNVSYVVAEFEHGCLTRVTLVREYSFDMS